MICHTPSKRGATCRSGHNMQLSPGGMCWEASFTLPSNDTPIERDYNISVSSSQMASPSPVRVTVAAERPGPQSGDRGVLMALYNATDGPNWRAQQGWMSSNSIGNWRGVITDANGNVTQLILDGYGLNGRIPPELGNLSSLTRLILNNNTLTELPPELGNLSNLIQMDIINSKVSGPIPRELSRLSNLNRLTLLDNRLSGAIPPKLGDLTNLTYLRLSGNQLTGCVPEALRAVSNNDFASLGLPSCEERDIGVPPPPELSGDRVYLTGGTLNGQSINTASPSITVSAGEAITGTVNLDVHNDHFGGAVFPVEATPTWGDHERSYWRVPISVPAFGSTSGNARVNLTAPTTPGEYAIIFVAQAELSRGYVASATHWPSGSPRWDNGDDVASWDAAKIDFAIENGYVLARQYGWDQANALFGAAAIKVVVTADDEPVIDPTDSQSGDRVYLTGGTLNGQSINTASPSITVSAGEAITGTVNLDVHNDHFGGAVFPVEATPTWGDHERSYWRVPISVPAFGSTSGNARVNLTAPTTPGEYAIIFVAQAELSRGYVASATHWPSGSPRWDNGDDVASWDAAKIDFAIENGYVLARQYGWDQANALFGAAAIKVVVTADEEDEEEEEEEVSNCLQDILRYTSDRVEHAEAAATIRQELGENWVIADWNDLKSLWPQHQEEMKEFLQRGGRVNVNGDAQWGSTGRWYFIEDHDGSKPGFFLAHDELGGHEISLGSWFFDDAYYLAIESTEEEDDDEQAPDLVVESPSVSEGSVDPEERFTLSATVRNQGDEDADSTTLRYYRSTDSTISTSDTEFDTDDVSRLRPDRTSDESVRLDAPSDAGTYYFGACVDSVSDESNTQNNCSDGVAVTVLGVDLVVHSVSASETRVELNGDFDFSATVENQGDGEADSSTLRYYRSTDSTINTSDTELTTDSVSSLDPDETSDESEELYPPTTAGTYYYGVCVDTVSGESDTQNNCSTGVEITVVEGDPELSVRMSGLGDNILGTGVSFTLTATVRNYGQGDAATTTLRYYRSTDSSISTSDTLIGTDSVGSLGVEETEDYSETVTTPDSSGTYYYGACVDTVPGESDIYNNCSGMAVGVGDVNPDLEVYSPSVYDKNFNPGQRFGMAFWIRNQGTGPSPTSQTAIRYYRSDDATISSSDTELFGDRKSGTGTIYPSNDDLVEYRTTAQQSGTYYYGACVDVVARETNTQNNCAAVFRVIVN